MISFFMVMSIFTIANNPSLLSIVRMTKLITACILEKYA